MILFAFLAWRQTQIGDVMSRNEAEYRYVLAIQDELRKNQIEMLSREADALRNQAEILTLLKRVIK